MPYLHFDVENRTSISCNYRFHAKCDHPASFQNTHFPYIILNRIPFLNFSEQNTLSECPKLANSNTGYSETIFT